MSRFDWPVWKGISSVQASDAMPVRSAVFDDPTLVSAAGLVPAVALAQRAGLAELAGRHLSVPGGVGTAAGAKVTALVAGVVGCHRPNLQQGVLNKEQAGVDGRRLPVSLVPARRPHVRRVQTRPPQLAVPGSQLRDDVTGPAVCPRHRSLGARSCNGSCIELLATVEVCGSWRRLKPKSSAIEAPSAIITGRLCTAGVERSGPTAGESAYVPEVRCLCCSARGETRFRRSVDLL